MREIRPSGSEGGVRFKPLSLPLSSEFGGGVRLRLVCRKVRAAG